MKISSNGINLYDTLFSGQCFRMSMEEDGSFTVVLSDRVINVKEMNGYLYVQSNNMDDLESVVRSYFDLDRNYDFINKEICSKETVLKRDINLCKGYKILRQDSFEMFITYIISQNNNVKRIMGSVDRLCELYGEKVIFKDREYYLFPTFSKLKNISLEELRSVGVGFRDKYIKSALERIKEEPDFLEKLKSMNTENALNELMSIKGIGMKVASCIMLFGYSRFDTFPVDTWVRHFVSENFDIKDDIKSISNYMRSTFGEYSGIAIQYFFHIERNKRE